MNSTVTCGGGDATKNTAKIDQLIAKFSYPVPIIYDQSNQQHLYKQPPSYADARLKQKHYMNNTVCFADPPPIQTTTSAFAYTKSSNQTYATPADSEKTKFLNILKSLFAVFDPECRGCIDINEIDKYSGTNNEILKDVINFIRGNQPCTNKRSRNPVVTSINFDQFVRAAETVLTQRRQNKLVNLAAENMSDIQTRNNCALFSSSSSSSTPSSPTAATTLSQAFESSSLLDNDSSAVPSNYQSVHKSFETHSTAVDDDEINSYDLTSVIDRESQLLRQGLDHIDSLKQFYLQQLVENRLKTSNISKLKHQNLFSIDRMLSDLNRMSDFNRTLGAFVKEHAAAAVKTENDGADNDEFESSEERSTAAASAGSLEFEVYLRQKQDRIESLQKEKSQLIRKLFEVKSEAECINKNLTKLQSHKGHESSR